MAENSLTLSKLFSHYLLKKLNKINTQHRSAFRLHYLFLPNTLRRRRKKLEIFKWANIIVFLGHLYTIKFKSFLKRLTTFDREKIPIDVLLFEFSNIVIRGRNWQKKNFREENGVTANREKSILKLQ